MSVNSQLNSEQTNNDILTNIQSLQSIEKQLFSSLSSNTSRLSPQQQKEVIDKINQLSNMRTNLYSTLASINNYYKGAVNQSTLTLKDQLIALQIIENELNRDKLKLKVLEAEKNNKIRLIEINNFYGEKYKEHTQMMKVIIFMLIPILILTFLNKKNILPTKIFILLVAIISLIGVIFLFNIYSSIVFRDNMNYQEYDWKFNANDAPKPSGDTSDPWSTGSLGTCIGNVCCSDGMLYDSVLNKCVANNTTTTESFIESILTKTQPDKYKTDYNLDVIKPYNT